MSRHRDPVSRLAAHFSAAIQLSNAFALEELDETFLREDSGIIRYFLDANAIRFFLQPASKSRLVDPFDERRSKVFRVSAETSAEILLSGDLPGQYRMPCLVTPGHVRELLNRVLHLMQVLQEGGSAASESGRLEDGDSLNGPQSADVDSEFMEAKHLQRLRDEQLMQPHWTDPRAAAKMASITDIDVTEWEERLSWALELNSDEKKRQRDARLIKNDAETVALTVALNRESANASPPTRYVIITADRSLFNAGVNWWESSKRQEGDVFPLRMITQYIPTLRATRAPSGIGSSNRLRHAMDSLLSVGVQWHQRYPLFIPEPNLSAPEPSLAGRLRLRRDRLRSSFEKSSAETRNQLMRLFFNSRAEPIKLNRTAEIWEQLTQEANLYFEQYHRIRSTIAITTLEGLNKESLLQNIRNTVAEIESIYVELGLRYIIASRLAGQEDPTHWRVDRGMAVIFEDYSDTIGDENLPQFLQNIVSGTAPERIQDLARMIDVATRRDRALLLCGCVAFATGDWETASLHGRLADKSSADNRPPDIHMRAETSYFRAVSARFAAMDIEVPKEIFRTLNRLDQQIEEMRALALQDGRPEIVGRAQVEEALWRLTRVAARSLYAGSEMVSWMDGEIDKAEDLLVQAADCAPSAKKYRPAGPGAVLRLERLMALAVVGFMRQNSSTRHPGLSLAISEELDRAGPLAPAFYRVIHSGLAEQESRDTPEHSRIQCELIAEIDDLLKGASDTTWLDRAMLERYHKSLSQAADTNPQI